MGLLEHVELNSSAMAFLFLMGLVLYGGGGQISRAGDSGLGNNFCDYSGIDSSSSVTVS